MFRFSAKPSGWLASLVLVSGLLQLSAQTDPKATRWEAEIRAFETSDRTNPPPHGAILFLGSSSFRLWKTLPQDFPGKAVINRGFGGSEISDSTALADRIIFPYHPRLIVLYAGDNDLANGKSASQVVADYLAFVHTVRARLPEVQIAFLSIKPSPSRWHLKTQIEAANQEIAAIKEKGLLFIDVYHPMLGPDGNPDPELFMPDKLHPNAKAYHLWTRVIAPYLK